MPVAVVKEDGPVECKLTPVERERLAGQEVHRNAVGTECVEHEDVVGAIRCVGDGLAGVAQHDRGMVAAVSEEMEIVLIARKLFD